MAGRRAGAAVPWLAGAAAALVGVLVWLACHDLPFLSDSNDHLAAAATRSPWSAFDPARHPPRPLQHLLLHGLVGLGMDTEALARLPNLALHAVAAALLANLAWDRLASRRAVLLAVAAFLLFPTVQPLYWVVAVNQPAHACAVLLALRSAWSGNGRLLALGCGLALLSHEKAVALPFLCVLAAACGGRGRAQAWLRDPWWRLAAAVALGWGALLLLRGQPMGLSQPGAIAANGARALYAFLPEALRLWLLDGLRGAHGPAGQAAAGTAALTVLALGVRWFRHGGAVERAGLLLLVFELVAPLPTRAFAIRHAYLAAALLGLCLAAAWLRQRQAGRRRLAAWGLGLLLPFWAFDSVQDVTAAVRAGRLLRDLAADAAAARAAAGPEVPLVLLDLPPDAGPERDVPLLSWGAALAMQRLGVRGPLLVLRTGHPGTSTSAVLVDRQALLASPPGPVLEFDPATRRLRRLPGRGR